VAAAIVRARRGACGARQAGVKGEFGMLVGEGFELRAIQQFLFVARAKLL